MKPISEMTPEEMALEAGVKIRPMQGPKFASKQVQDRYATVDPALKAIVDSIPSAVVTSAYRDPTYNAQVGGVPNSLHTQRKAIDLRLDERTPETKKKLEDIGLKTLIHNAGSGEHLHVEGLPDPSRMTAEQIAKELNMNIRKKGESIPSSTAEDKSSPKSNWMKEIADTAFGLTFPGQLYNQWRNQQSLISEVQMPGEVPPAVAAVRGGLNAATFGHAPQIAAGVEAPFSEKTYPELEKQYQDYYQRSAQERPLATGVGSELAMELVSRGLNKYIPGFKIGSEPAGFWKTAGKLATDVGLGALKGETTGLAGTYGMAPGEDVSFLQRLGMALPSGVMGGVTGGMPRAGSLIGREEANKEALMKPYEAEIQKRRAGKAANLEKAKMVEKDIPSFIQEKDIEYGKLKETPGYYEQPVNLTNFFTKLDDVVEQIKTQSKAGIDTQRKQDFLSQVSELKNKLTKQYGKEGAPQMEGGGYLIGDRGPKKFQAEAIPFSEAHAIQESINEQFGTDTLMGKLRKPLDDALAGVENAELSAQFNKAKSAYQKQKNAERLVQRKGRPEGLPEEPIYRPKVPEAQMPTSAKAIRDLLDIVPLPQGMKLGSIIEGPYHPMLARTASMQVAQTVQPVLNTLANLATLATSFGLSR